MSETKPETEVESGAFMDSLIRSNKQIKGDRAASIAEDAQVTYQREVQDLEIEIKRMKRTQNNMLDMSPDNTHSLIIANNFDAKQFIKLDTQLALDIRNTGIKLELAQTRYALLFGGE